MALTDPDKFGLLVQCRAKMDELNSELLEHYSQFVISLLSTAQLKSLLFTGLNAIKHHVASNQLIQMKSTLNELIQNEKKAKTKKQNQNQTPSKNAPTILIVPKNASLTKTIPFDIISNAICHFLKMSSITNLACCDRKLAIICHTPTSINNLMHRHDPYKYICDEECLIHDGCYYAMNKWTVSTIHRFKNVEQLAIEYSYLQKPQIFNSFGRVKHLSLHGAESTEIDTEEPEVALDTIQIMPSLETIKFVGSIYLPVILSFLKRYKSVHNQIKQVAFIDCTLGDINDWDDTDDDEMFVNNYAEMIHVLLPPQPNQLQTLKFVNASMHKTELTEYKDANDHFSDIEVIKSSLRNLKGLVYTEESQRVNNLYFHLTRNILSNLISFKKLESIHTHCQPLISCYLHQNNVPALSNVTELCISVSLQQDRTSPLYSLHTWLPKLERLCLVIKISDNDHLNTQKFKPILEKILRNQFRLKVFQIVTLIDCAYDNDPAFCAKRLKIVTEMINECTKVLHLLRIETYTNYSKRPLLFRLHVKSCHYTETECVIATNTQRPFIQALENMIVKYLMLYPIGKIQCRFTCNAEDHDLGWELQRNMKGLDTFLKVCVKRSGNVFPFNDPPRCCYNKTDFKQGSISAVPKHVSDQD
eukprot:1111553_1